MQANEAIKYLTGLETPLENHLLLVEALDLSFRRIELAKSADCTRCNAQSVTPAISDYLLYCGDREGSANTITASEWKAITSREDGTYRVLDIRSEAERAAFHLGGDWLPLEQLSQHLAALHRDELLICYCQSGVRSLRAVELLKQHGFDAKSVHGGLVEMLKVSLDSKLF